MSETHTSLDAAATDRKARLAKLASLKRKQPGADTTVSEVTPATDDTAPQGSKTDVFLSGRNYDVANRRPKLGFESLPQAQHTTVEEQADHVSKEAAEIAAKDEKEAENGIDLFKLQPKKRNWDLKRELAEKMKSVDVETQNAIARLVRERIKLAKEEALKKGNNHNVGDGDGEEVGVEGATLVEAVHLREKEEAEDESREAQFDGDDDIP